MKKGETKQVANIRVGKPDVKPTAVGHVRGVLQGNHRETPEIGDARRSTGIRPDEHDTIDPRMPKLSPS